MDKIYSRPRIRIKLPKLNKKDPHYEWKRKTLKTAIILTIAMVTANYMIKAVTPIIDKTCEAEALAIATTISNNEATAVMKDYEYEDLVTITKDEEGNITGIKTNVIPINKIISDVPVRIQEDFHKEKNNHIEIALGSFTGSKILSGIGPKIPIEISIVGDVLTDFKSEFISVGINQTLHRLYLDVTCNVSILTPFDTIDKEIVNQVILAENVIVGKIPSTYYNLEGLETNKDALEIVD